MPLIFTPAEITKIITFDKDELRAIEITLPQSFRFDGREYEVVDTMRPGTAFLCEPYGATTQKRQKRLYTRSNTSLTEPLVLQTIINKTREPDTSLWWQTDDVRVGDKINIRLEFNAERTKLVPYVHRIKDESMSLHLEPDEWWGDKRFLAVTFSTGITPALAHVRYMAALNFGRANDCHGAYYFLIVSAKNPRQLMFHEELLELERRFPENFRYHPVLTRAWPEDWPYTRGRIIKANKPLDDAQGEKDGRVDLSPLYAVVPDIENYHVRMCGGKEARDQLLRGFEQDGRRPLSFRAEVW